jgi:hypothetical protein
MRFRTVLIISILIFAALFSTGCSCGCGNTEKNTVKGFITVIGNEPFTKLAVKTDNGKFFVLKGSKELNAELNQKQGSYYVIQYGDLRTEDGNEVLIVERAIPVKNESK